MEPNQMTAAQKLGRLKQIDALQLTGRNADWAPLNAEKAAILATVGLPPLELMGNPWGRDWAVAFADTFPGFDADTLLVWFQNACASGAMKGAEEAQAADKGGLVAALGAILSGLQSGAIRCKDLITVGDDAPITLQEFIERALNASADMPELSRPPVVVAQNDIDQVAGALELCEPEDQAAFGRICGAIGPQS